jgi:hypothetical protein
MFSRRRTDQVYSTLQQVQQQVQRRMSEQGDAVPRAPQAKSLATQVQPAVPQILPAPSPTTAPATAPTVVPAAPLNEASATPAAPSVPPTQPVSPATSRYPSPQTTAFHPNGPRRYVLQLSTEVALSLGVVWLLTIGIAFAAGRWQAGGPGAGIAAGPAGNRETLESAVPPSREKQFVLVLQSQPYSPTMENSLRNAASAWNGWATKNPQRGVQPYFSVRKTKAGQVELFYGNVGGKPGVGRDATLGEFMAKPQSQGGGGFASAAWVAVDE